VGIISTKESNPLPLNDDIISALCNEINEGLPKVKKKTWTRDKIEQRCHLNVPKEYQHQDIDILYKHQAAISMNKYDLGLAKNFTHKIHLKDDQPIYR